MVWTRLEDPASGRAYYYNEESQLTQWEFPEDLHVRTLSKYGWNKADSDGRTYYYNEDSGESVWDIPEPVLTDLKGQLGDALTGAEVKGEEIAEKEEITEKEEIVEDEEAKNNEEHVKDVEDNNVLNESNGDTEMKVEDVSIESKSNEVLGIDEPTVEPKQSADKSAEELENEYKTMIGSLNLQSTCRFEEFVPSCINDERYWNIETSIQRKKLFLQYLKDKETEEFLKFKTQYKDDFFQMLKEYNVKYYTRWESIRDQISNEPIFKTLKNDEIRIEFFNSFIFDLKSERDKALKELKMKESDNLKNELLKTIKIDAEFAKIVLRLAEKYKNLTKSEMLDIFDDVIKEIEIKHQSVVEIDRKKNYKSDQVARKQFKLMIQRLIDEKILVTNSDTKWFEFITLIKEKPEFIELCGHKGSSAIDYYWDIIDAESIKLNVKIECVKRQLINFNKKIIDLTLDNFLELMKISNNEEILNISERELKKIFNMIKPKHGIKRSNEEKISSTEKRQKISLRK